MKKIIIIVLSLAIVLWFLWWKFGPSIPLFNKPSQQGPITLTYWGLWEEDNLIKPVIEQYQKQNPNITIAYERKSSLNYRTRVQAQIKEGVGPDVFRIHNSWLAMFLRENSLAAVPSDIFTVSDYKNSFYPVAFDSFVASNQIYGAPLGIDGLALFVNTDILSAANVAIHTNWSEFVSGATKVTVKDSNGLIKTAGAGIGTTTNIDYWSDILGLMLLQQQTVNLKDPSPETGAEVISFYTGFITDPTKKVWDVNLPRSGDMFISGNLAFYFAPFSKVSEIKVVNPNLKFKVVPVPQLPNGKITWGTFWGETVSVQTKFKKESWELIKFLTSKEISKVFSVPSARVDVAAEQSQDPIMGPFVNQGPMYKFWYLSQVGTDGGINDEIIKIWQMGILGVLQGQSPQGVLSTINRDSKGILTKYGVK